MSQLTHTCAVLLVFAAGCPSSNTAPLPGDCTPVDLTWMETAPRCGNGGSINAPQVPTLVTPGCQVVEGQLDFTYALGPAAPDLRGVRGVLDDLFFFSNDLSDLSGLETIERVGRHFHLRILPNLTSLRPLRSLRSVGGRFDISQTAVTSLEGLEQVQEVEMLWITHNPQLTSLRGLSGLCRIGEGGLDLFDNPLLPESEIQAFLDRVEILGPVRREPRVYGP